MQLRSTLLAGEDIDVTCTSGSVNFTAGEAVIDAMKFTTTSAAEKSETIQTLKMKNSTCNRIVVRGLFFIEGTY